MFHPPASPERGFFLPFDGKKKILLEVGCGKGGFACELAVKNPKCGVIALERVTDVILIALEKADGRREELMENLRFVNADASRIPEIFPFSSVSAIFLNFSDPWPQRGYWKRRLTHPSKLSIYENILKPGGRLNMKTDNEELFKWSLLQLEECGWNVLWKTEDLHSSEHAADNIMTEYEKNFTEQGKSICALCAERPERTNL